MSIMALIWLACLVIATVVSFFVSSPVRALAIASFASFVVVYFSVLYVGHPVGGVSFVDIVLAAVVTAGAVALLRLAMRRLKT
jgi:hypothetical protein